MREAAVVAGLQAALSASSDESTREKVREGFASLFLLRTMHVVRCAIVYIAYTVHIVSLCKYIVIVYTIFYNTCAHGLCMDVDVGLGAGLCAYSCQPQLRALLQIG
jgi:hypothetical protein